MTEHRWSKFWWADYKGDDALRSCSLAAQGLWMRLLCAMHEGAPYGHLTINAKPPTLRQIAAIASAPDREVAKLLEELAEAGVYSQTAEGVLFCRRMVRDRAASDAGREAVEKRWGNARKPNGDPNGDPNTPPNRGGGRDPHTLESESESDAESDNPPSSEGGSRTRSRGGGKGSRLTEGWQPDDPGFATRLGLDHPTVLAKFRDHFAHMPDPKGRSANWNAAWRTWCRREVEHLAKAQPARKTSQMTGAEQDAEIMRRLRNRDVDVDASPLPTPLRLVKP